MGRMKSNLFITILYLKKLGNIFKTETKDRKAKSIANTK
jgi:hypothetical protein